MDQESTEVDACLLRGGLARELGGGRAELQRFMTWVVAQVNFMTDIPFSHVPRNKMPDPLNYFYYLLHLLMVEVGHMALHHHSIHAVQIADKALLLPRISTRVHSP
jgi:hypothetical protein